MTFRDGDFEYEERDEGLRLISYLGEDREVTVPSHAGGRPVRIIARHAFFENGQMIERLTLPDTLREIESLAFELCLNMRTVVIPEGLEIIRREAFLSGALEVLHLPSSVREIEEPGLFDMALAVDPADPIYHYDGYGLYKKTEAGLSLETVDPKDRRVFYAVAEGTTALRRGALDAHEYLESISLPKSLTDLPDYALINSMNPYSNLSGITEIVVHEDNPRYFTENGRLFERLEDGTCRLIRFFGREWEYTVEGNVSDIAPCAFLKTPLRRITIPRTVRHFHPEAFVGSHVRELIFEERDLTIRFPKNHDHRLYGLLKNFGKNGCFYDFTAYDKFLLENTEWIDGDRVRMLLSRLGDHEDMTEEKRGAIRAKIEDNFEKIIGIIAGENDLSALEKLAAFGFFTADNIDTAIERCGSEGRKEAMAVLMEEKHKTIGFEEFDFSL